MATINREAITVETTVNAPVARVWKAGQPPKTLLNGTVHPPTGTRRLLTMT